jgi:hypothetical protein
MLRNAVRRMTSLEVRDRLESVGFDFRRYTNSLDAVHTVSKLLMKGQYPRLQRLPRDPHDESGDCWLHASGFCLSA